MLLLVRRIDQIVIVFSVRCVETFASEYRILSNNEKSQNQIKLNNFGFVTKTTRTEPAVLYVLFSETKNQRITQLFLPYCVDVQLKPPTFEIFEQFYKNGHVRFSDGSLYSVKVAVDLHRRNFETEDELDNIQDMIDHGVMEDAWCELCPEQELERLQCVGMERS